MSMISEDYIMRLLKDFVKTDAGKSVIAQYRRDAFNKRLDGGASGSLHDNVQSVVNRIYEDFKILLLGVIGSFRVEAIRAEVQGVDEQGCVRANISIDEDALRRESLHYMNKNLSIGHGEGVDDILALFTHGYTLSKRPYGFWVHDSTYTSGAGDAMTRIGARMSRDPNPFLAEFVDRLNSEYSGQCVVTLNEKYRMQGGG